MLLWHGWLSDCLLVGLFEDIECTYESKGRGKKENKKKAYNSRYSLVVTDPTTNQPLSGLTMGERTGSRIFH